MDSHINENLIGLRPGESVQVRSEVEILSTLDEEGALDGLPFMLEMRKHCGGVFRVSGRADKTCVDGYGIRRMVNTVFLDDLRCDGNAHAGCKRLCAIFWKEAWLKRAENIAELELPHANDNQQESKEPELSHEEEVLYSCQSTRLLKATHPLHWWALGQYIRDWRSGQLSAWQQMGILMFLLYNKTRQALGMKGHGVLRGQCKKTPVASLDLQPGELVEVLSPEEIVTTLDAKGMNRGLVFTHDMTQFCGHRFQVWKRVDRMILETSGELRDLHNTVLLKGVTCDWRLARGCPRANYHFFREVWLKRIDKSTQIPQDNIL